MQSQRRSLLAHILPMAVFLALLAVSQWLPRLGGTFAVRHAEFWVYPLQIICCGALLISLRHFYDFGRLRYVAFTLLIASVVFLIWIFPQQFLGLAPRMNGFDPTLLLKNSPIYWISIALRFLRLVIIVPFVEEIFWRAFLLRFLIDENFDQVSFGKFSVLSFAVVTLVFAVSHARPDWPAALCAGALYNFIAYRTRSLASCVLAHAFTNGLLGLWIMHTQQWGFW
jgi:CAAX prenyl protease-like protein